MGSFNVASLTYYLFKMLPAEYPHEDLMSSSVFDTKDQNLGLN